MAKALKGSVKVGFKQPRLDISLHEPCILYKGSQKKLREEKTVDVAISSDQDWFAKNIPCRATCPINTDARSYSLAISEGKKQLAYLIARQNNPFVSVLGKVCHAPCEPVCQRAKIDSPVALRALKSFAVEKNRFSTKEVYEWLNTKKSKVEVDKSRKGDGPPKVAIVGGGPAGLSAAHDLALMGYKVKVIEALSRLGGVLNAIPEYKLDKGSTKKDIDDILYLGVEVETNRTCGKDFSIDELQKQYDAVLLATGLQKGKLPDIPGAELDGVLHGVDFLKHVVAGDRVFLGEKVVVLGGGNVAVDIARTARRLRGKDIKVSVVCVEAAKGSKRYSPEDEMPADASEVYAAQQEGIVFHTSLEPKAILGEHGTVGGLKARKVKTVYDEEGHFNPTYVSGKDEVVAADTVIVGYGQELDVAFKEKDKGFRLAADGSLKVDQETMMTTRTGVFACGDMTSPGQIVDAVASGQKAAQSVHEFLRGKGSLGLGDTGEMIPVHYHQRHDTFAIKCSIWRKLPPALYPWRRKKTMDLVEGCYPDYEARRQGDRCVDCSIIPVVSPYHPCTVCGVCVDSCPAECISLRFINKVDLGKSKGDVDGVYGDGPWVGLVIDDNACIRCGACAEACWEDSMSMVQYREVAGQKETVHG